MIPDSNEIISTLARFPNGITLEDLAKHFDRGSYWTLRNPLLELVEQGLAESRTKEGRKKLYRLPTLDKGPTVPNVNPALAPVSIITLLSALAAKPPNEQQHIKLIKRLGINLATLAKLASMWKNDEYVDDNEVTELREQMEEASLRALWLYKVYQSILKNGDLWNPFNAYPQWYTEFTPTQLNELFKLLREQEYHES